MPPSDKQRPLTARPKAIVAFGLSASSPGWKQLEPSLQLASRGLDATLHRCEAQAQELLAVVDATEGPVLLLDLMACSSPEPSQEEPVGLCILQTQHRLALAQALSPHRVRLQWMALIPHGAGLEGDEDKSALELLLAGSASGVAKSLGREWGIWHRAVFAPLSRLPSHWLLDEIDDSAAYPELLYGPGALRGIPVLMPGEPATEPLSLPEKPAVVVSGGGSGITAEILEALARQWGPFRALILGRTPLPAEGERLPLDDPAAARAILRQREPEMSARELHELLQKELRKARLAHTLERLARVGIECLYLPTDIQDRAAVQAAVERAIEAWGQIDGVIHGAGIDRSRALEQKSAEEAQLVLAVKLLGLQHLAAALSPQPLRFWLAFGSVSARFGNQGQLDYAVANEAMARWITGHQRFEGGLVVDYTAWGESGMAASLASIMRERGVDTLPSKATATATAGLLASGASGEWVCAGRLPASYFDEPLLGDTQLHIPGAQLRSCRSLVIDAHPYLQDHRFQGAELMPGVVSFLSMREAASRVAWGGILDYASEIRFEKGLKIWAGHKVQMEIEAHRVPQQLAIHTSISSSRQRKGQTERALHAWGHWLPEAPIELPYEELQGIPALLEQDEPDEVLLVSSAETYQRFFHGPSWQVVAEARVARGAAMAHGVPHVASLGHGLHGENRHLALGMELLLQTAGIWSWKRAQAYALPHAIERCFLNDVPKADESLKAYLVPIRIEPETHAFEALLLGQDDRILVVMSGLQMRVLPL